MIRQLIRKEIKESLLSMRFVAALIFTVIIFVCGSLIFCKKYDTQLDDYQSHQPKDEDVVKVASRGLQVIYQQRFPVAKEPRLSLFFASGNETRYPRSVEISPSVMGRAGLFSASDFSRQRQNYLLERYQDFDMVFIVGVVLSFLAIVLAFDAISRDREQGTLRQQLSNAIPRARILLAKYTAGLVLLVASVILGSLCSIILIQALLGKNVVLVFPAESALNAVLGMLYLSVFIWLALWFSAMFSKPATGLAVMLLLWTLIAVLSPFVGGMLAPRLHPVESEEDFARRFQMAIQQSMFKLPQYANDVMQGKKKEEEVDWNVVEREFDEAGQVMVDYFLNHLNELFGQVEFAESMSFFSPYGAYRQAVERLSNTGLSYHKKFIDAAMQYRLTLKNFIRAEDLRDPDSRHRMIWFPMLTALSKKPVDPKIIPVFTPPSPHVSIDDVQASLPSIAYLLFLNVVFFFLALGTFARADVR
jgi:ABC-type transport system involved in multi-copper enzyme maturation permease subunit